MKFAAGKAVGDVVFAVVVPLKGVVGVACVGKGVGIRRVVALPVRLEREAGIMVSMLVSEPSLVLVVRVPAEPVSVPVMVKVPLAVSEAEMPDVGLRILDVDGRTTLLVRDAVPLPDTVPVSDTTWVPVAIPVAEAVPLPGPTPVSVTAPVPELTVPDSGLNVPVADAVPLPAAAPVPDAVPVAIAVPFLDAAAVPEIVTVPDVAPVPDTVSVAETVPLPGAPVPEAAAVPGADIVPSPEAAPVPLTVPVADTVVLLVTIAESVAATVVETVPLPDAELVSVAVPGDIVPPVPVALPPPLGVPVARVEFQPENDEPLPVGTPDSGTVISEVTEIVGTVTPPPIELDTPVPPVEPVAVPEPAVEFHPPA